LYKKIISNIEGREYKKNINLKNYKKKKPTKNDKQKDRVIFKTKKIHRKQVKKKT